MPILKALFIFKWLMFIKGQGTVSGEWQSRTWCEIRCKQSWRSAWLPLWCRRGRDWARRLMCFVPDVVPAPRPERGLRSASCL